MRRALVLPLLAAALVAGCGKDEPAAQRTTATTPAESGAERVVKEWSDDMRRGDIDGATALFAVPARVANGSPEVALRTRADIRTFNASLPCGSKVVETAEHAGLIIATFELTDRPGGDCGTGTGNTARAAIEVRGGKIVRWLRLVDGDEAPGASGPVV